MRCFYKSNSCHNLLCETVRRSRIKPHLLSRAVGLDLWTRVHSGCPCHSKWENNFRWEGFQEKIKPFSFRDQSINNFQIRYAIGIRRGQPADAFWKKYVHRGRKILLRYNSLSTDSLRVYFKLPRDFQCDLEPLHLPR